MAKVRAVIVGASGYSGGELCSVLLRHARAEIVGVFGSSRREEKTVTRGERRPGVGGVAGGRVRGADLGEIASLKPEAVFLCTPHEASVEMAPELLALAARPRVFDLSGGFRLKAGAYPKYYGFE